MSAAAPLAGLDDPRQTLASLARAIELGDRDAALRCFADDACLITAGARMARGRGEVEASLESLFARPPRIELEACSLESAREMAVGVERWRLRREPAELPRRFEATVVLRRLAQGWQLILAVLAEPVAARADTPILVLAR